METSYSASRTIMCTKSPAEGSRSPFLLNSGTCLYPVWEHKGATVSDGTGQHEVLLVERMNWVLYVTPQRRDTSPSLFSHFINE